MKSHMERELREGKAVRSFDPVEKTGMSDDVSRRRKHIARIIGAALSRGNETRDAFYGQIRPQIHFPQVKLIEETETEYIVQFGKRKYSFTKDEETYFIKANPYATSRSGLFGRALMLQKTVELILLPPQGFFQDERVSEKYREAMMFHEIREHDHVDYDDGSGLSPHERAVHDELLYVMKYFSQEEQRGYFEFAENYRKAARKKKKKNY